MVQALRRKVDNEVDEAPMPIFRPRDRLPVFPTASPTSADTGIIHIPRTWLAPVVRMRSIP